MEPLTPSEKKTRILENAAGFPPGLVADHARRLDADYFNEFSIAEIEGHLRRIAALTRSRPFSFEFDRLDENAWGLTVIGEDLPGFFAALSGVLASYDFDIRLGKVFSYGSGLEIGTVSRDDLPARGKIIDYLVLGHRVPGVLTPEFQAGLLADLERLIGLLQARQTQELRVDLYRRIGAYISGKAGSAPARANGTEGSYATMGGSENEMPQDARLPLEIHIDADERHAILTVRGTDRKALLFSLSNALALQGVSIQKLLTRSEGHSFEDRIFITDTLGHSITNPHTLERLKVAIILMERFMSTLPQASDYPAAIQAFNDFIDALMDQSGGRPDLPAVEDFTFLSSLAKILGAGPYLWEEMTKLPLGEVTGLLHRLDDEKKPSTRRELEQMLRESVDRESAVPAKAAALNRFKDFQLFRLEAVHLIFPLKTLQEFSAEISNLAEVTLTTAMGLAYGRLVREHGEPRLGEGPCPFGLFAQGKLGGRELGYASDLEVQLIYAASGETQGGPDPISHGEFFSRVVSGMREIIVTRNEGIFELDLRLRPHGDSGPLASQMDRWNEYYGEDGGALDYERQALLKLRPISGSREFADKVMAARDSLVFGAGAVDIAHTLTLRAKQVELKGAKGVNAKFSPGGLVEVEYTVQFLQLRHGRKFPDLREPNTEAALEALLEEGILDPAEFEKLYQGYVFLRRLINALRMVRGHSRDLMVPPRGSDEFLYLAKRMGYLPTARFEPDAQLDWDLQHVLKDVHGIFALRFLENAFSPDEAAHASRDGNDEEAEVSITAAFLEADGPPRRLEKALRRLGVFHPASGPDLVKGMLEPVREKGILCAALVVAAPKLRASPDAESVLRHLGQYLEALPDPDYFVRQLLNHPYLNEILIKAFGHSDYLANILIRQPEYLMTLGDASTLEKPKLPAEFHQEILEMTPFMDGFEEAMDSLRRYRNREYLRIGLRDIWLGEHLHRITAEISHLSNALIESAFGHSMAAAETIHMRDAITVIALGKLGGNELNYSSDIDIVFVYDPEKVSQAGIPSLEGWARLFISALSAAGSHGKMFRVDTQLRPYGGQGQLIGSLGHYDAYFRGEASGWELQAWLKARPVAGNLDMGRDVVRRVQAVTLDPANREKIETSMRKVRQLGLDKLKQENRLSTEVKLGPGGIRTIEFYVQYLQVLHGRAIPELISGNTLTVLGRLYRYRLLSPNYHDLLSKSYVFLRRIEHVLQLQGLQQRHELPASSEELEKLAKRMGFEERLGQSASAQFRARYRQHMLTLLELSGTLFGYETNLPADASRENQ
ncbi:MAG: glutamate-ammonia ligase adenylyltransferase [Fibrobacteres bacterium]|nr:glutamate-ammonia ligase adenylyltransferase [Fibrobacterota bacterium]